MPKRDLVRRTNQLPPGLLVGGGTTILLGAGGGAADTVDGYHASATPTAGMLLPLDSTGKFPASALDLSGAAGAGLVYGDGTLNVGAGDGILVGADSVAIDTEANLTWTGAHTFQGSLTTRHILPEATDTYDLGSSARMWRKGWLSELEAVVFAEQTASLVGGWLIVPHGQGTLAADVGATDTTVDFGQAMTVGDFVVLRSSAPAVEYMQVGSLVSGTTYNVTRDLDGSGANAWPAGTVYLVLGQSGDGRIELNAQDTPRIQVLTQGATYNAYSEMVRIGSLNGAFGISDERYGVGIGDYAAGNYLRYEPAGGFLLKAGAGTVQIDGTGILIGHDASTGLRFAGAVSGTYSKIYDSSQVSGGGGLGLFSSTQYWGIHESGGAKLAMDGGTGGFLKLQPRSGATGVAFGLGDASNNWVVLHGVSEPSAPVRFEIGIGSGPTPPWVLRMENQIGPYYGTPNLIWVCLQVGAGPYAQEAIRSAGGARLCFIALQIFNLNTMDYAASLLTNMAWNGDYRNYYSSNPQIFVFIDSTGAIYLRNDTTQPLMALGWLMWV